MTERELAASVVIPCRDVADTIGVQLDALAAQIDAPRFEVVVADNGSSDGTAAVVREFQRRFPDLRYIDAAARPGASAARNEGVRAARADLLLFCDADDRASPDWVSSMVRELDRHPIVGGRLCDTELNDPRHRCWYPPISGDLLGKYDRMAYASGASMGIRRQLLDRIGGWDESFVGIGGEDADLCFRAQTEGGATLGFCETAVMQYRYRTSMLASGRQARSYGRGDARVRQLHRSELGRPGEARRLARGAIWIVTHSFDLVRGSCARGRWYRRANLMVGLALGVVEINVNSVQNRRRGGGSFL